MLGRRGSDDYRLLPPLPLRIEGDIAYVPLTKGYEAVIDAADAELIGRYRWYSHVQAHTVYARCHFRLPSGKLKLVTMHRLLLEARRGQIVDHISRDGLDNRRQNIRFSTTSQNAFNRGPVPGTSSRLKGVTRLKSGKWQAGIKVLGKSTYLGLYETEESAHAAYVEAAAELHGPFARAAA